MEYYVKPVIFVGQYGSTYEINDPRFDRCTLYTIGNKGLAVIEQYYSAHNKHTWWGPVEPCLRDAIYTNPNFKAYFDSHATEADEFGRYFVVPLRVLMRALRMPPLKKEIWETRF